MRAHRWTYIVTKITFFLLRLPGSGWSRTSRGRPPRRILRYALAVLAAVALSAAAPAATVAGGSGFVTVVGGHLQVNGQPFRPVGINIYNANSNGWCWYPMTGGPLDDALTSIGASANVIRAWFFQPLATVNGTRDWSAFDETLAVAKAHGYRVVATLTDQWGDCGATNSAPGYGYKDTAWYAGGYKNIDPAGTVSYRDWAQEVASRYKDDTTILAWQLVNEPEVMSQAGGDCSSVPESTATALLKSFADDVSTAVRAADPNHLISLGTIGSGQCGAQGDDFASVMGVPNLDLCEFHDYDQTEPLPGDQYNGLSERLAQCNALGKPLIVGELGVRPQDVGGTLADRANTVDAKLCAQITAGAAGVLVWNWDKDGSLLNNYDIGPGDPVLGDLAHWTDPTATCAHATPPSIPLPPPDGDTGPPAEPGPVGVDESSGKIYVGDMFADGIYVVDPSTKRVLTTISVPHPTNRNGLVSAIAVDSARHRAYAAIRYMDQVLVIDTTTDTIVRTIALPVSNANTCQCDEPFALAVDPGTGHVFVANVTGSTVTTLDPATGSALATLTLRFNTQPDGLAFDAAANRLYVSENTYGDVAVVDPVTDSISATISTGANPAALALGGGQLFVGNYSDNSISVVDTATNTVTDTLPGGSNPFSLALDVPGHRLFVPHVQQNYLTVYDTQTGSPLENMPMQEGPIGVAYGAAAHTLYVARYRSGDLALVSDARAPSPPLTVVAAAGDGSASVSWTAPADDGGSPITAYTVSAGGVSTTVPGTVHTASVAGLTDGVGYAFVVTATNAAGTSQPSVAAATVTPTLGAAPPATAVAIATPTSTTTVSTGSDPAALGGSASAVTVPAGTSGGTVSVAQASTTTGISGYQVGSTQFTITAPTATPASPLALTFTVTPLAGETSDSISIYRTEGTQTPTLVPDCADASGQANPDPCIASRLTTTIGGASYIQVQVLTSSASRWDTANPAPSFATVSDSSVTPPSATLFPGATMTWRFAGKKNHTVTEVSGLGPGGKPLFDSGVHATATFSFVFDAAGTYPYKSTVAGDTALSGTVAVPVVADLVAAPTASPVSVSWATRAPVGYVFDIQYRFRPAHQTGWKGWIDWKTSTTSTHALFTATQGAGTYAVHSRLRNVSTKRASAYSPDVTITFS